MSGQKMWTLRNGSTFVFAEGDDSYKSAGGEAWMSDGDKIEMLQEMLATAEARVRDVRAEFPAKEPRWEIISMEPAPFDGMPSYAQLEARVKELEWALETSRSLKESWHSGCVEARGVARVLAQHARQGGMAVDPAHIDALDLAESYPDDD